MIVVDSNVIAYLFLPCEFSDSVERLRIMDEHWIAPDLWVHEMLSILSQHHRHRQLAIEDARSILADARGLMSGGTLPVDPFSALLTAIECQCSAYDAQFITLARALGHPLYTFDKKILATCPDIARRPE